MQMGRRDKIKQRDGESERKRDRPKLKEVLEMIAHFSPTDLLSHKKRRDPAMCLVSVKEQSKAAKRAKST